MPPVRSPPKRASVLLPIHGCTPEEALEKARDKLAELLEHGFDAELVGGPEISDPDFSQDILIKRCACDLMGIAS